MYIKNKKNQNMKRIKLGIIMLLAVSFAFAQSTVNQTNSQIQKNDDNERTLKRKVAIARFSNETEYGKGIFYDKNNDPLAKQALDILSTKLAASNKFILLERQEIDKIMEELKIDQKQEEAKVSADYLIVGSITEFGRKNIGDVNVLSRSKTQIVQAGVSIRLIDVGTGQIIYSEEAKGEAETTNKTVLGYGERTGYDATLSDKAISAAISKLVENIINNSMDRPWKSFFLAHDENGILISGGKSQGLMVGDTYEVIEKGRKVKNPQTGMLIELPGKRVGTVKIDFTGGEQVQNEFSIVSFVEGSINAAKIEDYYIKEIK